MFSGARKEKGKAAGKKGFLQKRKAFLALLALGFLLAGFLLGQAAGASPRNVPGSEGDPLVTASWVEAKLEALARDLKGEQQTDGSGVAPPAPQERDTALPPSSFEVVTVPEGSYIYPANAEASTEFILRAGEGRAVESPKGNGLSDLTTGKNLAQNQVVQRDHLILAPRGDGRGIFCPTESIFMVRGEYRIGTSSTAAASVEETREERGAETSREEEKREARVAVQEGSTLSLRKSPGSSGKPADDIVDSVYRGQLLTVLNTHNDGMQRDGHTWWEVHNPDTGVSGWTAAEYLQLN